MFMGYISEEVFPQILHFILSSNEINYILALGFEIVWSMNEPDST